MTRRYFLSVATLALLTPGAGQAQPISIVPWPVKPAVVINGPAGDERAPLVHAAVAHWNGILAGLGSGFRLGPVLTGGAGEGVGKIVVNLSDGEFISNARRSADGRSAVVNIRNTRGPLPNVPRNVIAHELGHAMGCAITAIPPC